MGHIKIIFFLSITFYVHYGLTVTTEAVPDEYLNKFQLPDNVHPIHYKVSLTVNTEKSYPIHSGSLIIYVYVTSMTNVIILNAKNLKLMTPYVNTSIHISLDMERISFAVVAYKFERENLIIYFKVFLSPGRYTLGIRFASTSESNLYQSPFPGDRMLLHNER